MPENALNNILFNDFKSFLRKVFDTLHPIDSFADNWHIDLLAAHLHDIERRHTSRLIINIPPRYLKSILFSVAWPAWLLGHNPGLKIIVASYSDHLSHKHSSDCRLIMESQWYKELFGTTSIATNRINKLITTQNGFRLAASINGSLTGEGADVILVDDPHTPMQAMSKKKREGAINWFQQTLLSRLNDKEHGIIVVVMQRLHCSDLTGFLLQSRGWRHLALPVIATKDSEFKINTFDYRRAKGEYLHHKRDSQQSIYKIKEEIGEYAFAAQYQQSPLNATQGAFVKGSWLKRYRSDELFEFEEIYQSWDCAIKVKDINDYSVCTTWGVKQNSYFLLDVFRNKLEYPELLQQIQQLYLLYRPQTVIIEDKAAGQQLLQSLKSTDVPAIGISPRYDKATRLMLVSPDFERGNIVLPDRAPWLKDFLNELLSFPHVKHDDQVDSVTQMLLYRQGEAANNTLQARDKDFKEWQIRLL